jgi:hypothetical protein
MNMMIILFSMMMNSYPGDLVINYFYTSGTVAPPYKYQYNVKINARGEGMISYSPDQVFDTLWTQEFRVSKKNIKKFWDQLYAAGFFKNEWKSLDKHPIGGSYESLEITAKGKIYKIPPFPADKDNAEKFLAMARNIFPKKILEDMNAKKEKMIEEYKKP